MKVGHGWDKRRMHSTGKGRTDHNFESALEHLLSEQLEMYRKYVPNADILASYVEDTRRHLVKQINRVFSTQIETLRNAATRRK